MQDVSSLTVEWESSAAKQSSSVCVVYWLGSHFTIMPLMKFLFLNHDVISWSCFICGLLLVSQLLVSLLHGLNAVHFLVMECFLVTLSEFVILLFDG